MSRDGNEASPTRGAAIRRFQVAILGVAILIGLGLLIRRVVAAPSTSKPAAATALVSAHAPEKPGLPAQNPPDVAAKAARDVLDKLKSDPDNFDLLVKAGNIYLYSRVFPGAIQYYGKALQIKEDAKVRNDYANALFYARQVDAALQQYETILKADPRNANALFNRGMVRWQGKSDAQGAVESWKALLKASPKDPRRANVEEMIALAERHLNRTQK
jgi:tetratricopeptide (TPR) repeat protein